MKSGLKISLAIVSIIILAGIVFLFWQRGPHLPHAQTPQPPGTFIPKNQLVFVGYKTPEATLESAFWAFTQGDYGVAMTSASPKDQADLKKQFGGNPKRFKSEMRKESTQFKGVQILARKILSDDKVELKFQMVAPNGLGGRITTNCIIQPLVKIGQEWKLTADGNTQYKTNCDKNGDVVTFTN
jgi:hypothetical protein